MKSQGFITGMILVAVAVAAPMLAHAEKMDLDTDTLVIQKLESVLNRGDLSAVAKAPMQSRLADLEAERARLTAMKEAEKSCDSCLGSRTDREKALQNYKAAFETLKKNKGPLQEEVNQGFVLLQMAHLYEILNEKPQAQALYKEAVGAGPKVYDSNVLSTSYLGLADALFEKAQFAKAMETYEKALRLAHGSKKGYITYRMAWCRLNQGDLAQAQSLLKKILKTPELVSRETETGPEVDTSFQDDVSRDLATFYARGEVTDKQIQELMELTPAAERKTNLAYLATETERLGNKKASLHVWALYAEKNATPGERLEVLVRGARLQYDLNDKKLALEDLQKAAHLWNSQGCKDPTSCPNLKLNMRKLVTDWGQSEKKQPTPLLLAAYQAYLVAFKEDMEFWYWSAQTARELKQPKVSAGYYRQASVLAAANRNDKNSPTILEASLLGEIEMAELAKDVSMRKSAYQHYLDVEPQGSKAFETRYQLVYMDYEQKQMESAALGFQKLSLDSSCRDPKSKNLSLCVKSADLSLDCLVALKDDARLEQWSKQLAQFYPQSRVGYLKIARTSVLKQSVGLATREDYSSALQKISQAPLQGASNRELVAYYKTQISLAEKAKNLKQVTSAAHMLEKSPGISTQDREFALERQAWAAEMSLDFKTAYQISLKLSMRNLTKGERLLRLALLAELSGKSAKAHEQAYLALYPRGAQSDAIRAKQVKMARNEKAELKKNLAYLRHDPALLAPLALEIFAKTNDQKFANEMLSVPGVRAQPAGQALVRDGFLKEEASLESKVAHHRIRIASDALVQRTLGERLKLLAQLERESQKAIASGDFIAQAVSLTDLAVENTRIYNDVMALPVPRRLNAAAKLKYKELLAQKAQIYVDKANAIYKKTALLWDNSQMLSSMLSEFAQTPAQIKPVFTRQLQRLAKVAPSSRRSQIEEGLKAQSEAVGARDLLQAQTEVKEQPFDTAALERFLQLERKSSKGARDDALVAYLDARLSKLQNEKPRKTI